MSAIDKLANHVDSPLSKLRKLSPSVTHAFNEYPLFYEAVNAALSVAIVNYIATFTAQVALAFKENLVDKLVPFVYDYYRQVDEFIAEKLLKGVLDAYVPLLKSLHYKNLTPTELYASGGKLSKDLQEYAKVKKSSVEGYIKSQADPIVANTVSSVNPVLAPVNKTLESVLDTYLPAGSTVTSTTPEDNEVTKLISLTRDATGRTINVAKSTASKALKLPSDITGHVSKIYGSELKEHKSIPSAIVHTSSELVSEVTAKVGLNGKTEVKTNGAVAAAADAVVAEAPAAVTEAIGKVESQLNGQISVGA